MLVSAKILWQKGFCPWYCLYHQGVALLVSWWFSSDPDVRARAIPVSIRHPWTWVSLSASPSVFISLQMYRNSVIAQWKAMNLDVLLTPMLGPALDLNAPGRATGEALLPFPQYSHFSLPSEVSPVCCGAVGRKGRVLWEHPFHGRASFSSLGPH